MIALPIILIIASLLLIPIYWMNDKRPYAVLWTFLLVFNIFSLSTYL